MSVLRKILSPKQTQEDGTTEEHSQPNRTLSASSMNAEEHKASSQPRPRSEELENVDYGKPSDFLKGSLARDAAEKQVRATSPDRSEGSVGNEAYSDVAVRRPYRGTVGASKRQQEVKDAINFQVQSLKKGHSRSHSFGHVTDTSEYSTPWNQVLQEREHHAQPQGHGQNQDGPHVREQAGLDARPQDIAARDPHAAALGHHYETPSHSNPPPKPARTHFYPDISGHPTSAQSFTSSGTIDHATVDRHNTSSIGGLSTSPQPGDYDEPWDKRQREKGLNVRMTQKPKQQDSPLISRDKMPLPAAGEQKVKLDRKFCRTPTPDDSITRPSAGSDSDSVASTGGHIDRSAFSTSTSTSSPRSHLSRPLPAPPVSAAPASAPPIPPFRRPSPSPAAIQIHAPLDEQPWYRPELTRADAEKFLENQQDFSFVVRNSESCRTDYSLSIRDKSPNGSGFIHLRIEWSNKGFVLGQFSNAFPTVPECIAYYTRHRLTIRGAEHKRLSLPTCT